MNVTLHDGPRARERSGFFCTPARPDRDDARTLPVTDEIGLRWSLRRDTRATGLGGFRLHNLTAFLVDGDAVVGYIEARKLTMQRRVGFSGAAFYDFCDSISAEMSEFAAHVVEHHLLDITFAMERGPVYYLERIEVKPSHTGRGLGVRAMAALRDAVFVPSRATACYLQPAPLQFSSSLALNESTRRRYQAAKRRLVEHYRRHWGLAQLGPRSRYWYIPCYRDA